MKKICMRRIEKDFIIKMFSFSENIREKKILKQLKKSGFLPEMVKKLKFSLQEKKSILTLEIQNKTLKKIGLRPSFFLGVYYKTEEDFFGTNYYTVEQLVPLLGFTIKEIKEDGLDLSKIEPFDLSSAGYSLDDLIQLGFRFYQVSPYFSTSSLVEKYSLRFFLQDRYPIKKLLKYFSWGDLAASGWGALSLRVAGATPSVLKKAGFSASQLLTKFMFVNNRGKYIYGASFSVKDLKGVYTPRELKKARVSCLKLKEAGYKKKELLKIFVQYHLNKIF